MKFLVDMNLSPRWCPVFHAEGWDSVHWSAIGVVSAPDPEIMQRALADGRVVFTNDLDFGTTLALTRATGPSVIQVRTQDLRVESLSPRLIPLLLRFQRELEQGALLVVDEAKSRVRILPLF
jgi:predicted nuclease of predicted toxin-antitoxin system